jgi:hypothetical protein
LPAPTGGFFRRNGNPLASLSTLDAFLSATRLHDAVSGASLLSDLAVRLQGPIDKHAGAVTQVVSLTGTASAALRQLFQDPDAAFSKMSLSLLGTDRTEWWDSTRKYASAAAAAKAVADSIASQPETWGHVLPGATQQTDEMGATLAARVAQQLQPIMESWLDASKQERFWRPLAEQSGLGQMRVASEVQLLATRAGVSSFGATTASEEAARIAATTRALQTDTRGVDPGLAAALNALRNNPAAPLADNATRR